MPPVFRAQRAGNQEGDQRGLQEQHPQPRQVPTSHPTLALPRGSQPLGTEPVLPAAFREDRWADALTVDETLYGRVEVSFTLVEGSVPDSLDEVQHRAGDALHRVLLEVPGE